LLSCRLRAKRNRDREHKRRYRETGQGREQRRRERERLDATRYQRFWRKAHATDAARLNRQAARRFYERHRDAILRKQRERYAAQRMLRKASSK
jgi:hypothetical protein